MRRRASPAETALVTRQLASFMEAGVPLTEALRLLASQGRSAKVRGSVARIHGQVQLGESLSAAMAAEHSVFGPMHVAMIRAAEDGGGLAENLRQLAVYLDRERVLRRRLTGALAYPMVVLGLAGAVVVVLLNFVLPGFAAMFRDMHTSLPPLTQAMLGVTAWSTSHSLHVAASAMLLTLAGAALSRSERMLQVRDALLWRIPMIGAIRRDAATERFARTFATSLGAGVALVDAFDLATGVTLDRALVRRLVLARGDLMAGEGLAWPLEQVRALPAVALGMLRVGERTGQLQAQLQNLADLLAEETAHRAQVMMAMLEPLVVGVVGVIVGVVALSVITPMYALVRAFR